VLYKTKPYPNIKRHKDEETFLDPHTIKTVTFPSLEDSPSLELSVIVPAYNEEQRCMLLICFCFGESQSTFYLCPFVIDCLAPEFIYRNFITLTCYFKLLSPKAIRFSCSHLCVFILV